MIPNVGETVERFVDGEWRWDWVLLKRIDGPRDPIGNLLWIEQGVVMWGRNMVRFNKNDQWRSLSKPVA